MKKILIIAAALCISVSMQAQTTFGAGLHHANHKTANLNGFYAEIGKAYLIKFDLGFAPSLRLNYDWNKGDVFSYSLCEISAPIMFDYGLELSNAARAFIYAGPTPVIGLAFNEKTKDGGVINNTNLYQRYKRFDIMVGAGIGLDLIDLLRIKAGYDFGVINNYKDRIAGNQRTHNKVFTIGISLVL